MADDQTERFEQLYRLADKLIAQADKEDIAEAARILALLVAPEHLPSPGAAPT